VGKYANFGFAVGNYFTFKIGMTGKRLVHR
jgi:hypothetical protein